MNLILIYEITDVEKTLKVLLTEEEEEHNRRPKY